MIRIAILLALLGGSLALQTSLGAQARPASAKFVRQTARPGYPDSGDARHLTPQEREAARQRIGITLEQQSRIEAVYTQTDQRRRALRQQLRDLYHQLHDLYSNYHFDRNRSAALRQQIVDLHAQQLKLHEENEEKLRRILTPDQFERLHAEMNAARQRREGQRREKPDRR